MKRLRSSGTVAALIPSGSVSVLKQIDDTFRQIQSDVSQIITEYNAEVYPVLSTLPQGVEDIRWNLPDNTINPKINGLDGANVLVDIDATSESNGGRFWLSTSSRPTTIKESLSNLYTDLSNNVDQLRTEIGAATQGNPVAAYNTSAVAGNLVEDDVRSIVFDGSNIIASAGSTNVINVAGFTPQYAGVSSEDQGSATTLTLQSTFYQYSQFETNSAFFGATPDYTNDHITIAIAGDYLVSFSCSFQGTAGPDDYEWSVHKNNGATQLTNIVGSHSIRDTATEYVHCSGSGPVTLAASDTIELWARCTSSAGTSVTGRDVSLNVIRLK
jgi:hypothetical protein